MSMKAYWEIVASTLDDDDSFVLRPLYLREENSCTHEQAVGSVWAFLGEEKNPLPFSEIWPRVIINTLLRLMTILIEIFL